MSDSMSDPTSDLQKRDRQTKRIFVGAVAGAGAAVALLLWALSGSKP
jgi:hypothetical protein